MLHQSYLPRLWLILDDGSNDGTEEFIKQLKAEHSWIKSERLDPHPRDLSEHVATIMVYGFNKAISSAQDNQENGPDVEYVAKVDADVELERDYFAHLLAQMEQELKVGMASGSLLEPTVKKYRNIEASETIKWSPPGHHTQLPWAAAVVWRRDCYQDIGGIAVGPSHESVEAILARAKGWDTETFQEPRFKHLRPLGSASGFFRGYTAMGRAAHYLGLPGWLATLKATHLTLSRHPTKGLGYLAGYAGAWFRRLDRCPHQVVLDHYRNERWQRIKHYHRQRRKTTVANEQETLDPNDHA